MADDKPKPLAKKKKHRRASSQDEYSRYIVATEGWDWSYSFGLAGRKDSLDPYMEHRHLKIIGRLLYPAGLKVDGVELWFLPSGDLDEERRKDHEPKAVGSLSFQDGRLNGCCRSPKIR
jgi:hypothetical protein